MTNEEWLESLAHNDIPGLRAWFKAERAESPVAPDGKTDGGFYGERGERSAGGDTAAQEADSRHKLEADAERYIEHAADYAYEDTLWADETFTLYDAIIELLDRQAAITERECRKPNWSYCETCEALEKLTAERDKLKDELIDECGELNRQINTMRDVIRDYRNERDHYRSKFDKCIDYADAIHALMDEGLA